jgi:hypothetical protein
MKIRRLKSDRSCGRAREIDEELRRQKTKQTVLFTDIVGSAASSTALVTPRDFFFSTAMTR